MLFPYTYVAHGVEKLHSFIAHTVLEVWCKAKGPFKTSLLHPDFEPIVINSGQTLLDAITTIYNLFKPLTKVQREQIADGFKRNNDIKGICEGTTVPMRFKEIEAINKPLADELGKLNKELYTSVLKLAAVKKACGVLDEHYDEFMKINGKGKCPFCGLDDVKSEKLSTRDPYDHYLPKDIYPFNSVNFENLIPVCVPCNSSYKGVKDLFYDKIAKKKRKAFYPFGNAKPDIIFRIEIRSLNFDKPKDSDVSVQIDSGTASEETAAWREVYGIDERYKDKCASEDSRLWLQQVCDDIKNYELDPTVFFPKYINGRNQQPFYLEYNFLRIPYLQSCYAAGYVK
jgi:hypothetical protein